MIGERTVVASSLFPDRKVIEVSVTTGQPASLKKSRCTDRCFLQLITIEDANSLDNNGFWHVLLSSRPQSLHHWFAQYGALFWLQDKLTTQWMKIVSSKHPDVHFTLLWRGRPSEIGIVVWRKSRPVMLKHPRTSVKINKYLFIVCIRLTFVASPIITSLIRSIWRSFLAARQANNTMNENSIVQTPRCTFHLALEKTIWNWHSCLTKE